MSENQLQALLARLKDDAALRDKLQAAENLDAAEALAREAGFDVSKDEWLQHQAQQPTQLSDSELETVAGGGNQYSDKKTYCGGDSCIRKDGSESCSGW